MQWNPLVAFLLIVTWLTPIPAAQDPRTAQRRQGRKIPPAAPSFPVAAPLPAPVADERVVEVKGQISDLAVDYRKVYWLRIYPNFTCEIRLPDECTGLVVGNPKLFLAYALEIEKVKNKDGTEYVRRDNRVIIVQPQLGDSERGNLPVECSMSVPLRNRKTIFFNLQIAQSKPESNFQVNIRDGEAERIEVERFRMQEAARREAEARRTQDEKSVAALTGRWQTFQPQGGKAAASKQTTVGTFELYLLREDRFLLAALVEPQARGKAKTGKPPAQVNRL